MKKGLISISLSPNVFPCDIEAARKMLAESATWVAGKDIEEFERALAAYFNFGSPTSKYERSECAARADLPLPSGNAAKADFYTFNSGRSALLALLKAFDIGKGDEVLLQAFTCNAVPNPVLWAGARPVYVDVDESTYNISPTDLGKKITKKTKAVIVQHTFGLPCDMDAILALAEKHGFTVIEDCAHSLGALYKGKKVGILGEAAFLSFGRDKVISSVYGGAAIISAKCKNQNAKLRNIYETIPFPSSSWVRQQLRHPIVMARLMPWYNAPLDNYGIGKVLLQTYQVLRYISKAVHWKEKQGRKPDYFPARMPNALAYLALTQFKRLESFNKHRRELAKFYYQSLIHNSRFMIQDMTEGHVYLRYPLRHRQAHEIIKEARSQGILLGDWYNAVVAPDDTGLEAMHYKKGSCPVAERLTRETFNLPTNPNLSMEDAKRVVEFIKHYGT